MAILQKKICLLGMFGVGKTSLVRRYVNQIFEEKYHTTIGVKVDHKLVALEKANVNLLLWDIAGQEEEHPYVENYFRGAHGALIVYDVLRPESVQATAEYCARLLRVAPHVKLAFTGNKSDLAEAGTLNAEEFKKALGQRTAAHFFTSAKSGENVEAAFTTLAQMMIL